jgi:hypothetical protein
MNENRKPADRARIYAHFTPSQFLHLEDALAIGKVRLFAGTYARGQGAQATAFHFLDLDDARVLFSDLAQGKGVSFADYKGTANSDAPQSRVLLVETDGQTVWLEVQNGRGQVVGQGAVKPAGDPTAAVSIPLSTWEARKLAGAILAYIQAWEARHLLDALAVEQPAEAQAAA